MRGRALPLSIPRRFITDLMYFAAGVPTVAVQRRMNLGAVVAARAGGDGRLSWPAIFSKAYAMVAQEIPELRRVYLKLPWPHLYEYPASIAHIAVEREFDGEQGVFGCAVLDPASLPVTEIAARIAHAATAPAHEIKDLRRICRVMTLPLVIRRAIMWAALSIGRQRANYCGTFAISATSSLGADILTPLSVWTTLLTYSALDAAGALDVRIIFDHRTVDAGTVARALVRLETVLNGPIADELRALRPS